MPPAVTAFFSIVSTIGSVVTSVVGPVMSVIGSAIGAVVSTVGSVVGGTLGSLWDAAKALGVVVLDVSAGILGPLVDTAGGVLKAVADVATGISAGLTSSIETLSMWIDGVIGGFMKHIWSIFGPTISAIDNAVSIILSPVKASLEMIKGAIDTITAPVEAILTPLGEIRKTIQDVCNLKILYDLIKGQSTLAELMEGVGKGKTAEAVAAIAELYKSITTTSINLIDKVDTETELLWTTIDQFDERIKTSVAEDVALARAEVMAMVTPRLDTIGAAQTRASAEIARLTRHLEDGPWFVWMLLRALR